MWLLRSPANRCNLSDAHYKALLVDERGARKGIRILYFLVQLKKEDKDMTARQTCCGPRMSV